MHIEKQTAKTASITARTKWKQIGNKCSRQFFKVVLKKNTNFAILGLRNRRVEVVNERLELEDICFDFYSALYKGQHILEGAILEVFDGLLASFTEDMNMELFKQFFALEFFKAIERMANGKALGHDSILVEFFSSN